MDVKVMLATFGMIFLAELGDKTQLATFCMAADCDSRLPVFVGASLALITSSFIAVMFGGVISRLVPEMYIKIAAGLFFIIVGLWMLLGAVRQVMA